MVDIKKPFAPSGLFHVQEADCLLYPAGIFEDGRLSKYWSDKLAQQR